MQSIGQTSLFTRTAIKACSYLAGTAKKIVSKLKDLVRVGQSDLKMTFQTTLPKPTFQKKGEVIKETKKSQEKNNSINSLLTNPLLTNPKLKPIINYSAPKLKTILKNKENRLLDNIQRLENRKKE